MCPGRPGEHAGSLGTCHAPGLAPQASEQLRRGPELVLPPHLGDHPSVGLPAQSCPPSSALWLPASAQSQSTPSTRLGPAPVPHLSFCATLWNLCCSGHREFHISQMSDHVTTTAHEQLPLPVMLSFTQRAPSSNTTGPVPTPGAPTVDMVLCPLISVW